MEKKHLKRNNLVSEKLSCFIFPRITSSLSHFHDSKGILRNYLLRLVSDKENLKSDFHDFSFIFSSFLWLDVKIYSMILLANIFNFRKGALRIPLVAQNSSVLLLPKVAASLKLHDSTAKWCFCWFLAKNLQVHIIAKMIAKMNLQTWWNFLESTRPNV